MDWAGVHWTMVMWPVSEFRQPRERCYDMSLSTGYNRSSDYLPVTP